MILSICIAYLMNNPPHESLHHRCTAHPHSGHYQCSRWDIFGCCSPRQWSAGSIHIFHPRSVPCRCSCLDTTTGCSHLLCSPDGRHTSHPHNGHCHCIRQGRRTQSSLGLPIQGYRGSCRCHVGRYHGHYSLYPHLEKGEKVKRCCFFTCFLLITSFYIYI